MCRLCCFSFFFFNDTATTEIYTLSLHDALPICLRLESFLDVRHLGARRDAPRLGAVRGEAGAREDPAPRARDGRSEEHTSELQSPCNIVCRLLLEKKRKERVRYSPTR